MKEVLVISTGGTIASKENESGRLEAGAYSGEELAEKIGLPSTIKVTIRSVLQKPSSHITFHDLDDIRTIIEESESKISGFVITHGTDTLEESAYYLDITTEESRPVVLTGSQRSPDDLGSDAFINLRHAIHAAASADMHETGVTVVFNERIFAARYVKKEHASNIQGFNAFGFGYLGIIDHDQVQVFQKPVRHETFQVSEKQVQVELIKSAMQSSTLLIDACNNNEVDGLIVEGYGRGQVDPALVDGIKEALSNQIPVVITTSSEEGAVYPVYDYQGSAYHLFAEGALLGGDYDAKKARIRLICALRSGSPLHSLYKGD
ncbi:asparaginase [Salisediminibacterium selenitireducens]|uniref:asparaginase n=1 Tax=Bacillus selenitireducens (strain ATCC 700615 / DSM 15326 / MLS10) TaxID=439292 RepID=D6XVB8_BACIE|nr:asparaginase [Salisediminibacterium selenitireducens]ADH99656.1 Asparaginase/glutaminase [[Bacillus] selenitireducens MLS10]